MSLIRSVSGLRGIYGESLSPEVIAAHAAAFADSLGIRRLVVGRDARDSGPLVLESVRQGLRDRGVSLLDVGLAATPAVQIAVERLGADGGLILTASHNPKPWNGLKFLDARGTFLNDERITPVFEAADRGPSIHLEGKIESSTVANALEWHVESVLGVSAVDPEAIEEASLRVVVDGCSSVGGPSTVAVLRRVGVDVIELDCAPDGEFTRGLEPVPENLGALGERVRETGAAFGIAHDPDGDRAALVNERGEPMGEEFTLAIAVDWILSRAPGPVVVNLSTSQMSEDLARHYDVPFSRSPVGEIHVVEAMRESAATVGGEGNGGVIVPAAHLGRDGSLAAVLTASFVVGRGEKLSHVQTRMGRYTMKKEKLEKVDWRALRALLKEEFAGANLDERDGLRFSWPGEWLHVRPSGTEPIVRIISEAGSEKRVEELCSRARQLAQASQQD